MDHTCSTCRYYDLPTDAAPCDDCIECRSIFNSGKTHWAMKIEDIQDPSEKIEALAESGMYLMMEMIKLREKLDELTEEIKQRR